MDNKEFLLVDKFICKFDECNKLEKRMKEIAGQIVDLKKEYVEIAAQANVINEELNMLSLAIQDRRNAEAKKPLKE